MGMKGKHSNRMDTKSDRQGIYNNRKFPSFI